ncbi:MAG: glycosyltransferase [Candidatus Omnitrophota bacterium]
MENKIKIAFLLSQFPETHETFILREFTGMKEKGMEFELYSLKQCKDKIVHDEAKKFIQNTSYPSVFSLVFCVLGLVSNPLGFLKAYGIVLRHILNPIDFLKANVVFVRSFYFARIMRKHGITHIHAHWATMPTTSAEIISVLLNIPFSFTAHAWDIFLQSERSLRRKVQRAEFVVTCTRYNKDHLEKVMGGEAAGKIFLNYHGLDLQLFSLRDGRERLENIIIAVGRLVEQKGFEYLIRACGILKRQSVVFRCLIIGEGELKNRFEKLIDSLSLKGYVEMPGVITQAQIRKWLRKANVFVAPSVIAQNGDRDGIPNVILEAMALGVPVVASDVSGIPEVVINGETGLLVAPAQERELAKALERVLRQQVPLEDFKRNGRKKIEEEFDIKKNVGKLIEIMKLRNKEINGNMLADASETN